MTPRGAQEALQTLQETAQERPGAPQEGAKGHPKGNLGLVHSTWSVAELESPLEVRFSNTKMHETHVKYVVSQLLNFQNHGLATCLVRAAQAHRRVGGL